MIKKVFIIAFLVNHCLADFNCPFPDDVPDCDCRADIRSLSCKGTVDKPIQLPSISDTISTSDPKFPFAFDEVILENIIPVTSPATGDLFEKITANKITIKNMDFSLLKNIEKTGVKQLTLNDIKGINTNFNTNFLDKKFLLLTHLTIINGSIDETIITGEITKPFDNLKSLRFIDLKEHRITDFKENSFANLASVEKIDLSSNSISLKTNPKKFTFTSTDVAIDLRKNKIDETKIDENLVFKAKDDNGFISVDLRDNKINELSDKNFEKFCPKDDKENSVSFNLDNNPISCKYKNIKWIFTCKRSLDIFQRLKCSEYEKYFAEMGQDEFIDAEKPKGDLEITIKSVNLAEANLVNVAVCVMSTHVAVQKPNENIPKCSLCVRSIDETKEKVKNHDLNKKCPDIGKNNEKYGEDSLITIGIASKRHNDLVMDNVEGFALISLYEDIIKSGNNGTDYQIKSSAENSTWTAVVNIKWTENKP